MATTPPQEVPPIADPAGCAHYRRHCRLLAPCCGVVVTCRVCHDEESEFAEKPHKLDRKTVKLVQCTACSQWQAPQQACQHCGQVLGQYFCGVCNLFDDDLNKKIYHCAGCGICRIGPQSDYFHCDACGYCMPLSQRKHECKADCLKVECPVCFENLFDSRQSAQTLPCGHAIHAHCLRQLMRSRLSCPLCNKAVGNFAGHWQALDREIALTPMPPEYRHYKLRILCNDCNSTCVVRFHILGAKCKSCGSYNTTRVGEAGYIGTTRPAGVESSSEDDEPADDAKAAEENSAAVDMVVDDDEANDDEDEEVEGDDADADEDVDGEGFLVGADDGEEDEANEFLSDEGGEDDQQP